MWIVKNPVWEFIKFFDLPCFRVRKTSNRNATYSIFPLWVGVLPSYVVLRTCRQDFHLVSKCQTFSNKSTVVFRTTQYFCTVALNNECEFHVCVIWNMVRKFNSLHRYIMRIAVRDLLMLVLFFQVRNPVIVDVGQPILLIEDSHRTPTFQESRRRTPNLLERTKPQHSLKFLVLQQRSRQE